LFTTFYWCTHNVKYDFPTFKVLFLNPNPDPNFVTPSQEYGDVLKTKKQLVQDIQNF
jgi:hypothetical protein